MTETGMRFEKTPPHDRSLPFAETVAAEPPDEALPVEKAVRRHLAGVPLEASEAATLRRSLAHCRNMEGGPLTEPEEEAYQAWKAAFLDSVRRCEARHVDAVEDEAPRDAAYRQRVADLERLALPYRREARFDPDAAQPVIVAFEALEEADFRRAVAARFFARRDFSRAGSRIFDALRSVQEARIQLGAHLAQRRHSAGQGRLRPVLETILPAIEAELAELHASLMEQFPEPTPIL